jgi:tetratricopeptide (TPR) repeat protein
MTLIRRWLWIVAISALAVAAVLACGPFFGIEVLPNRKETLLAAPAISFEKELAALVPAPNDKLPVVEGNNASGEPITRATVEAREQPVAALLPAVEQYAAGANSFHHGDPANARMHFQAILALPPEVRKSRELWAHFMLGRLAEQQGDDGGDNEAARQQFQATRSLARQGTADPLGLAVNSLGEEARVNWKAGQRAQAVELYAQQAAYGSRAALNSLVTIAGLIAKDDALLDKAIDDPLTRHLLFICLNQNNSGPFFMTPQANEGVDKPNTADRMAAAMERHHLTKVAGAGLLASAAYQMGRFDLAEKFSAWEDVPISSWVKAKLALRRGDRQGAMVAYENALKGHLGVQLNAEAGALRVSRGDYIQALDLFCRSSGDSGDPFADYWGDAAYLAERVLTLNELQSYVDNRAAVTAQKVSPRLRSLLARRLMRAGRRQDALRYFDDEAIRVAARQYIEALSTASSFWHSRSTRAEAWFTAALLARARGMELLGFERAPDYAMWDGQFVYTEYSDQTTPPQDHSFESADERKHVLATSPAKDVRFQYRLTAVDHAMAAADLLPHSSEAFAAVLCSSSTWVIDREPKRARQIYSRYLQEGAYVPWGQGFGHTCPSADFRSASNWGFRHGWATIKKHVRAHPIIAATPVACVALIAMAWLAWRRAPRTA